MYIYEVVFKEKGKGYFFQSHDSQIPNQAHVIVETERGLQYGKIINKIDQSKLKISLNELKSILRMSTLKDDEQFLKNCKDADSALKNAKKFVYI